MDTSSQGCGVAASGEALRQARQARGLSIDDIAQTLKLAPRQVEAIEAETFDILPGAAFARGFIRNYARYLGLDPAPLLERLKQHDGGPATRLAPESFSEGSVPLPSGYRSTSLMPAVGVVGVLLLMLFVSWRLNLLSTFNTHHGAAATAMQSSTVQSASEPVFPPHTEETAVVTAQVEPQALPGAGESATRVATSAPVAPAASAPASSASLPVAAASAPVDPKAAPLVFNFEQDAWVEVRDATGHSVFSRLGKAGERQEIRGKAPFTLKVGNAPHVKLSFQGQAVNLQPYTKADVARVTLK